MEYEREEYQENKNEDYIEEDQEDENYTRNIRKVNIKMKI